MDKEHHDSFGDFLGALFQLFLLGAIIYFLFLVIWGIFKLVLWLLKRIWQLITWVWFQIRKHAVLQYRINRLNLATHAFLLRHGKINRIMLCIRTYFLIFWTSRPSELFNKLSKSIDTNV